MEEKQEWSCNGYAVYITIRSSYSSNYCRFDYG